MSYKKFETLESFLEIKDVLTKYKIDSYTSFQNFALYSSHNKVERYFVIYDLIKRSLPIQGDVIEFEDIDYKRPGGNLNPEMTDFIVGRTLNKNIKNDHILTKKDLI